MLTEPVTRRRALALGAAAGLTSLVRVPLAGAASPRARASHLDVPRSAFGADGSTGVLRAPSRFALLGATGVPAGGLEVRARPRGGAWSRWAPLHSRTDHAPDHPRRPSALAPSEPVWTGPADEIQIRGRRVPRGGLRLTLVSVPPPTAHAARTARARIARAHQSDGPPAIISRDVWNGGRVKPKAAPAYGDVQMAFVHHTESANDYGPQDSAGIVLAICKYHESSNGWNDIGYNFLVDRYGQIFEGRAGGVDQAVIGAHAGGWNSHSTGIATIGSFMSVPFTDVGMDALARLLGWKLSLHGVPCEGVLQLQSVGGSYNRYKSGTLVTFQRISGHRDGCTTACPGDVLYGALPGLRGKAAGYAGPLVPQPEIDLAVPDAAVPYGDDATFSGQVRHADGSAASGVPVRVEKRGGSSWVAVARTTTRDDGTWSAAVPWRRGGSVRAVAEVDGAAAVHSRALSVDVLPAVALAAVPRRVRAGAKVVVRGRVRPSGPVSVLVERRGSDGRWRRVGTAVGKAKGSSFTALVGFHTPALYRLTPIAGRTRGTPVYVRAARRVAGSARTGGAGQTGAVAPAGGAVPSPGGLAAGV